MAELTRDTRKTSRGRIWGWFAGWLVLAAVVSLLLVATQRRVVASLDRPEVRAEWQRWKEEAQRQSQLGAGPVQRKAPRTNEPPALILLRDHFPAVWGSALILSSCLYAFFAIALQGAVRTHRRSPLGRAEVGVPSPPS